MAAVAFAGAWLRGWPPAKLWRAAAWSLPMTGVYLAGRALQARTWRALALAPVHDWEHAWHLAQAGRVVTAFVLCAPVGVPAALCAAGTAWAWRIYAIETGLSGKTATAPVIFDAPAMGQAGPDRPRPDHRPGNGAAHRRARGDRDGRDHPRRRPPLAPGADRPLRGDGPASGGDRRIG